MNNSYITIIKEKRTVLSRKRVPLNQNECTANFRIGVPFEQNLHLAELQRKIGEIYFVDHYKMIADQFLYKKDFETSLFLRIAMETGIRSADIPCIEWSCMHGKTVILEETKRGDLYKKLNGTFPKISVQSLRIMKLLYRKQGKIFTKSKEYYVRKISCAWGIPGFHVHSFRNYRRKIERGISAGVQVPRIIPL